MLLLLTLPGHAAQNACCLQGVRKKAGRPIAYQGDPNDPRLTPEQRRKIRRRIANRESAQRVRARRAQVKGHFVKQVLPSR